LKKCNCPKITNRAAYQAPHRIVRCSAPSMLTSPI